MSADVPLHMTCHKTQCRPAAEGGPFHASRSVGGSARFESLATLTFKVGEGA